MKEDDITTESATIRLVTPKIVENIILDYTTLEKNHVLEIKEINKQLTKGQPYAVLVDSGMLTTISKEARELSASVEFSDITIAKALLVRSMGHRLVASFYIKINKPHIKTKIFSNREFAIEWLKTQVGEKVK